MSVIQQVKVDQGLRPRLLIGSIGVAVIVSTISIIVAYRLAVDLGMSTELRKMERHVESFMFFLENSDSELTPSLLEQGLKNAEDAMSYEVDVAGNRYQHSEFDESLVQRIKSKPEFSNNESGIAELDDTYFLWVKKSRPAGGKSITVIWEPGSLSQALEYVVSRLSVTAFLTFWIAVWSALLVSTIIIQRVNRNNLALVHTATHDTLTDLPNRKSLLDQVSEFTSNVANGKEDSDSAAASLLLIDLDHFKEVNDTFGHSMGDQLLVALALRFRGTLNPDHLLVRIGGDEFVVWCEGISESESIAIANELNQVCRQTVEINNTFLELGASIGIASFPQHGSTVEELLKCADIAMYRAKQNRQCVSLYNYSQDTHSIRKIKLSSELNTALEQQQFVLYFQPKFALDDQSIVGVEALARWQHPQEGLIQPAEFINLIEHSGLVNDFGRYIVKNVIIQIRNWLDQGITVPIAANISPYNLADPMFLEFIQAHLAKYDVPANMLEIELTEHSSILSIDKTQAEIKNLKSIGVMISVDDFGTGMSSLSYLKELAVDYIKIDSSFILNMANDKRDQAIVKCIVGMIDELDLEVVAEGIETLQLANLLKDMGCHYGQGYYFSKPVSAADATRLLLNRNDNQIFGAELISR